MVWLPGHYSIHIPLTQHTRDKVNNRVCVCVCVCVCSFYLEICSPCHMYPCTVYYELSMFFFSFFGFTQLKGSDTLGLLTDSLAEISRFNSPTLSKSAFTIR